jgi:O-antigen ligase
MWSWVCSWKKRENLGNPIKAISNKTNVIKLSLVASLTTTLIGHNEWVGYLPVALIPIILLLTPELKKAYCLLKTSNSISLYLLYCLWILMAGYISQAENIQQVNFYLVLGLLAITLGILCSESDLLKKTMAYTLCLCVIITSLQRGIGETIDPPGLVITYKNLASLTGIIALAILISLKPKNSYSFISTLIIAATAIAIFVTPSQAGRISLIVLTLSTLWLYTYRLFSNYKFIQKLIVAIAIATIGITGTTFIVYHKEISEALGKKDNLGGRTKIWEAAYDWILLSPVTGNGEDFWLNHGGSAASNHHHTYVNRGYNGFLDTLVQTGIIGLALLLAFIVTTTNESKLRWGEKCILLLAIGLSLLSETHSFTGSFLIKGESTSKAILVFWLAYLVSQNKTLIAKPKTKKVLNLPKIQN